MTASYHKKYRKVLKEVNNWFSVSENAELHTCACAVGTDCINDPDDWQILDVPGNDVAGYDFHDDVSPMSSSGDEEEQETVSLQDNLVDWVVQAKLTQETCNGLLSLLPKHGCQLPKDNRLQLGTPRSYTG